MKYKISLCISALCFFTAFLIFMASRTTGEEAWHPALPLKYSVFTSWRKATAPGTRI